MLPTQFRIVASRDFTRVKDLGTKLQSKNFQFSYFKRKENEDGPSRFGFIVTTKMMPNAVDRNRVKRVLNEVVRQNFVYIAPGYDCVFLPNIGMLRAYTSDVFSEVKNIFKEAGIVK